MSGRSSGGSLWQTVYVPRLVVYVAAASLLVQWEGRRQAEDEALVEVKVLLAPRRAAYGCRSMQRTRLNMERGLN